MTKDEALDLALEALIDASGHVNNETFVKVMMARDAINDAIKQARSAPVQEPYKELSEHISQATNGLVRIDPVTGNAGIGNPPAAQRQWVNLTDDEIQAIAFTAVSENWDWLRFARAIEAKLREKNNG
jgi:hypothetical protein